MSDGLIRERERYPRRSFDYDLIRHVGNDNPRERKHDKGLRKYIKAVERGEIPDVVAAIKRDGGFIVGYANERDAKSRLAILDREIRKERGHRFLTKQDKLDVAERMGLREHKAPDWGFMVKRRGQELEWVWIDYGNYRRSERRAKAAAGIFLKSGPTRGKKVRDGLSVFPK